MAAWKSSDGGSIDVIGASVYDAAPGPGSSVIVSAVVNSIGVTVSSLFLLAPTNTSRAWFAIDGAPVLGVHWQGEGAATIAYELKSFFLQPGQVLTLETDAGAVRGAVTYKIH